MNKIKIGYIPFYTKLYDDEDPKQRIPVANYMRFLVELIRSEGIEVVTPDVELCCVKEEFDAAAAKMNADDDIVCVVTQHTTYSPSLASIEAMKTLKAPIVVFDTTMHYEFLGAAQYEDRIFPNHGIHGVMEFCSMLKRNGINYTIATGHVKDNVISELLSYIRAAAAAKAFRNIKVGKAGGSFEGMGDFIISDETYKKQIGGTVYNLTPEIMNKYLPLVTDDEIAEEVLYDVRNYDVRVDNADAYKEATRTGLAMRKWMNDEKLDGVTVNFLHTFENGLPKMPFVECCKVMERGLGYAGEGDTLTAGLCSAFTKVYPVVTFCEPFCPDWEKDLIFFSHTGEMNTKISRMKPVVSDLAFPYNESGDTVTISGAFPAGKAVLVNLVPVDADNGKFDLILADITMTDDGFSNGAYEKAIQGWMDPGMPIREFLKKYSYAGGTHHSVMVYNVSTDELEAFGRMMGFNTVIIK